MSDKRKKIEAIGWDNDNELLDIIKNKLYTAVIGDIMDKMGYLHQFLPPQIRPLAPDMKIAGRAMTVVEKDTEESESKESGEAKYPFGMMFAALDGLRENEIYICSGASPRYALWGELMCTRARTLGAAGAIIDGYLRDTKGILSLHMPVFACGSYAQDQAPRGKVVAYRVPIKIEDVVIRPGDLVVGDVDGVVVVPKKIETQVIQSAYQKVMGEDIVRSEIMKGRSCESVFKEYKIM